MTFPAPPPESPTLPLGQVLGERYRVGERLGRGGMGEVFAGEQIHLGMPIAIKVLRRDQIRPAERVTIARRFLREARAASAIKHPNVVEILDAGDEDGQAFYVMERLHGRDLAQILETEGKLPWAKARGILLQAARGLRAAHLANIIHRDVKPANIFVVDPAEDEDEAIVKVLDFGIAKLTDADPDDDVNLTESTAILGSVRYMAPEQALSGEATARSDVYALGVVAYHLLTGHLPFSGRTKLEVLEAHRTAPPKPLRHLEPSIPPAVEAVILRAMAKSADDRYGSMRALIRALSDIDSEGRVLVESSQSQDQSLTSAPRLDATALPPPSRSAHARGRWAALGAALVATALALWIEGRDEAPGASPFQPLATRAAGLAATPSVFATRVQLGYDGKIFPPALLESSDVVASPQAVELQTDDASATHLRSSDAGDSPSPSLVRSMVPQTASAPPLAVAQPAPPERSTVRHRARERDPILRLQGEIQRRCADTATAGQTVKLEFATGTQGQLLMLRIRGDHEDIRGTALGRCVDAVTLGARFPPTAMTSQQLEVAF